MSETFSPTFVPGNIFSYTLFDGMDRSRPRRMMEGGQRTALWSIKNGYIDWRGIIRSLPTIARRPRTVSNPVFAAKFFDRDTLTWAERTPGGILLASQRGHNYGELYGGDESPSLAYYRGKIISTVAGQLMVAYDGARWLQINNDIRGGFAVPVQRRLAVGGFLDEPTVVKFSRVDNEEVFPAQETEGEADPQRASFIDIQNILGSADRVTALGSFEINRLVIFTADQALIYVIDPSVTQWTIDQRANIRIGAISHAAVMNAGSDLLYASRFGFHAVTRTDLNAIQSVTLSTKIERLWRRLVRQTPNLERVSGVYDPDLGLAHIFFPNPSGVGATRLTCNLAGGYDNLTWTTGDFANLYCGDALAGQTIFGGAGGLYDQLVEDLTPSEIADAKGIRGNLDIETGVLWMTAPDIQKQSEKLIIRASGKGRLRIFVYDENGNEKGSHLVEIEGEDDTDDAFPILTLEDQYRVDFNYTFRGIQLRFVSEGDGDIQLVSFDIKLAQTTQIPVTDRRRR